MILATVGTQLPFPRLIDALDAIAGTLDEEIFAQVGDNPTVPRNMQSKAALDPIEFENLFGSATRIVGHAGVGTYLSARKFQKPIIIFPRLAKFNEHRNDHQLATARQLAGIEGVYLASNTEELEILLRRSDLMPLKNVQSKSLGQLCGAIRSFIEGE